MTTKFETIEIAKQAIHAYALEKGWYSGRIKSDMEALMLAIGELSEAAEEYRDGRPEFYVVDAFGQVHNVVKHTDTGRWHTQAGHDIKDQIFKPEGISIEIVDCVIRLLDWAGYKKYDLSIGVPRVNDLLVNDFLGIPPVEFCFTMAKKITHVFDATLTGDNSKAETQILLLIESCNNYINSRGYDMMELIQVKHDYNMTRQVRHGGKVI